jgi:hypothetical protein
VGDADSVGHIPQTWQVYRMGGVTQGRLGQFESGAPRPLNGTADAIKDDPSTPRPPSQCSAAVLQHFFSHGGWIRPRGAWLLRYQLISLTASIGTSCITSLVRRWRGDWTVR